MLSVQANKRPGRWLSAAALILGALFFFPLYLTWAIGVALRIVGPDLPEAASLFVMLYNIPQALLFSRPASFLLIALLTAGLAAAALLRGQLGRLPRALLALTILAVLASPFLARYQSAVVAAPDYEMRWPTRPSLLGGVAKRARTFAEGRSCEYALLGWNAEGHLYYREACEGQAARAWAYSPEGDEQPQQVTRAPADLMQSPVPRASLLEWVRAPGVDPAETEVRHLLVRRDGLASPDGKWVALVVRHIYGPEDVIALSHPDEEAQ